MFVGIVAKSCTFHNVMWKLFFHHHQGVLIKNERIGSKKKRQETTVKHVDKGICKQNEQDP